MNLHNIPVERELKLYSGVVDGSLFWVSRETHCRRCDLFFGTNEYHDYELYGHHACASRGLNDNESSTWVCDHSCNDDLMTAHYYQSGEGDTDGEYFCYDCLDGNCPEPPPQIV